MRILNVYATPDLKHGSERSLQLGTQGLRRLGHELFIVHAMDRRPETAVDYVAELGLPVLFDRRSKFAPPGLAEAEGLLHQFIADHRIDVIHLQDWPRRSIVRRLTERWPTVVTVHVPICPNGARYLWKPRVPCDRKVGIGCLTKGYRTCGCGTLGNQQPMGLAGFVRSMIDTQRYARALAGASRLVAPSSWLAGRLIADGMPADRVRVVHAPLETDAERLATSAIACDDTDRRAADTAASEMPTDLPAVLYVGRMVDFKGVNDLLRASARTTTAHQVWVIGAGPQEAMLRQLAVELGISDRVRFLGEMSPVQIEAYRARTAVAVVPSLCPEIFGMVGPEAMRAGLPVVAYRVGGIPEWLTDNVNGRLVPVGSIDGLADALSYLLERPELRQQMGSAGKQAAGAFGADCHAARLSAVYDEAIASFAVAAGQV